MTPDSTNPTTAVPPAGKSAPPELRLRLDSTLAGGGVLDGGWWPRSRRIRVGWFRGMDAHTIGVTRAFQDRLALLVVPPQATTAAAGTAMAMAADATNSAGPADILAASGITAEDSPSMPPRPLRQGSSATQKG